MTTTETARRSELVYRFEAKLGEMYPIGRFDDGIRFHNHFDGRVTDGPFAGARIFGLDLFTLRPDGVGVIEAPEVIDAGTTRVALQVRGYVVAPEGLAFPGLDAVMSPDFAFPDVPFRVTGAATIATADPDFAHLNRCVAVIEGEVSLATGALTVEARVADLR
jgi:hypothetical protein